MRVFSINKIDQYVLIYFMVKILLSHMNSVSWKITFDHCIFYYDGPTNISTFLSLFLYIWFNNIIVHKILRSKKQIKIAPLLLPSTEGEVVGNNFCGRTHWWPRKHWHNHYSYESLNFKKIEVSASIISSLYKVLPWNPLCYIFFQGKYTWEKDDYFKNIYIMQSWTFILL